ncbi:MAG: AI-2E family transporter [Chloroflexi bacterium]|nr:AI-2E family transporter [Chloroflexota bacterium]
MSTLSSPQWTTRTKRTIALIILALLSFAAIQLGNAWFPVVISLLVAYLLMPIVNGIDRLIAFIPIYEIRRTIAVLLTFALVIGALVLFASLIAPAIVSQSEDFVENLPTLVEEIQAELEAPVDLGFSVVEPWAAIQQTLSPDGDSQGVVNDIVSLLLAPMANIVGGVFSVLAGIFITIAMLFYAMKDGNDFLDAIESIVPPPYHGDVRYLFRQLGIIWHAYFRAQVFLGFTMGVVTYLGASLVGLPQPIVLGLLAGMLEFIPNLGPTLAATPAVLIALVTPSSTIPGLDGGIVFALLVVALYIVLQVVEGLFLVPRVMGYSLNLHPFIVLMAIIFGAKIAGAFGVIIAAPVAATLRLLGTYVLSKLLEPGMFTIPTPKPAAGPPLRPAIPPALTQPKPIEEGEIVKE